MVFRIDLAKAILYCNDPTTIHTVVKFCCGTDLFIFDATQIPIIVFALQAALPAIRSVFRFFVRTGLIGAANRVGNAFHPRAGTGEKAGPQALEFVFAAARDHEIVGAGHALFVAVTDFTADWSLGGRGTIVLWFHFEAGLAGLSSHAVGFFVYT